MDPVLSSLLFPNFNSNWSPQRPSWAQIGSLAYARVFYEVDGRNGARSELSEFEPCVITEFIEEADEQWVIATFRNDRAHRYRIPYSEAAAGHVVPALESAGKRDVAQDSYFNDRAVIHQGEHTVRHGDVYEVVGVAGLAFQVRL